MVSVSVTHACTFYIGFNHHLELHIFSFRDFELFLVLVDLLCHWTGKPAP